MPTPTWWDSCSLDFCECSALTLETVSTAHNTTGPICGVRNIRLDQWLLSETSLCTGQTAAKSKFRLEDNRNRSGRLSKDCGRNICGDKCVCVCEWVGGWVSVFYLTIKAKKGCSKNSQVSAKNIFGERPRFVPQKMSTF